MFFMHVFNVFFIKVKKTCFFMFFICKVMFFNIYGLKANISKTVHPIHSMFSSTQGFSGSADRMALFPVR